MTDLVWKLHAGVTPDMLGYIPHFLKTNDPRSAREQIHDAYIGGWDPFPGFTMLPNGNMSYPDDPPIELLAETTLRGETIRFYTYSWLAIVQPDGSFEVARLD